MRPLLIINRDGVKSKAVLILTLLLVFLSPGNKAAGQAPPAVTPNPHRVERVLLLSLDGLHAVDLANFAQRKPGAAIDLVQGH